MLAKLRKIKKGAVMKTISIIFKITLTTFLLFSGLILLTNWRLNGFTIFDFYISPETVTTFVDTLGSYFYWIYVVIIIFLIWKKKVKKK